MTFFIRVALLIALALPYSASAQTPAPAQPAPAAATQQTTAPDASAQALPASEVRANNPHVPKEMSPWSMFMSADMIVKAVMASLAFASVVTWTIFLAKSLQLMAARWRVRGALTAIAQSRTLGEAQLVLGPARGVVPSLVSAALNEHRVSVETHAEGNIKERADSRFAEIVRAEQSNARIGMGLLATIGSTSPFVGLFGTVWGIMNSFIGISKAQTTNLAVVAPGIAEALLATAIGLVAAIPAVIFYNYFARGAKSYLEIVNRAVGAVGRLLSRDLDRGGSVISRAAE